jgi:thermitase
VENFLTNSKNRVLLIVIACIIILSAAAVFISAVTPPDESAEPEEVQTKVNNYMSSPSQTTPVKVPGQIIVKFKSGITQAQINQELPKYNAKVLRTIEGINRTVIQVPAGEEEKTIKLLTQNALVQNAEANYVVYVQYMPNDPDFQKQWGLVNTGQAIGQFPGKVNADIDAEKAWDVSKGAGVTVAVIDTGLDMTHPDLAGKVIGQKVFPNVSDSIDDRFGHGTHIAGIIAADTNNGQGIAGVCPECKLLIAKAMKDDGTGDNATIAESIVWAADNGAKVINLSEGGPAPTQSELQTMQDALNYAWNKGAVIVAAAGNNGVTQKFYPAALDNTLAVAAVSNQDLMASFSNYGTWVDVAAPGENIFSTLPTKNYRMQALMAEKGGTLQLTYDYLSGTSMAAPIVSGMAALIWTSSYGTSNANVVKRIVETAEPIPGTGSFWQYGRVNAAEAVGANTPTVTPTRIPTPTTPSGTNPTTSQATPTQPLTPSPTSIYVTPSIFCLGSCPTPTFTPTPTQSPSDLTTTPTGSSQDLTLTPGITTTTPNPTPCETTSTSSTQSVTTRSTIEVAAKKKKHTKHKKRKKGQSKASRDGLLKQFLELLKQLLQLMKQIGGGTTPEPCISPTPTQITEPTASPSADVTPTGLPTEVLTMIPTEPNSTPTSSPSSQPTTTIELTPTNLPTIQPTSSEISPTIEPTSDLTQTPTQPTEATPTVFNEPTPTTQTPTPTPAANNGIAQELIRTIVDFFSKLIDLLLSLFRR